MTSHPHYFIGIPVVPFIQDRLSETQTQIETLQGIYYKSWTNEADFHITLKFLGAVDDITIDNLIANLESIGNHQAFDISIGGIGTFGNPTKPRVVWAGVEKNNHLEQLYQAVECVCTDVGFRSENRPFRPHITIAKKWKGEHSIPNMNELFQSIMVEKKIMHVDHFFVYQIHPSRTPKYKKIKKITLI